MRPVPIYSNPDVGDRIRKSLAMSKSRHGGATAKRAAKSSLRDPNLRVEVKGLGNLKGRKNTIGERHTAETCGPQKE